MTRPHPTLASKEALKANDWRHGEEELIAALREYRAAHKEEYQLGEDPDIDVLWASRWAAMMSSVEYIPVTDEIPVEYLADIEQGNAIYELTKDRVDEERDEVSTKYDGLLKHRKLY